MKHTLRHRPQEGFTLVVVAALFVAFAVLVAGVIEHNNSTRQITQGEQTSARMHQISAAILQYYIFNGHYPCPAQLDQLTTNLNFGQEVANCNVANPGIEVLTGGEIIRGMVPVQALTAYTVDVNDVFDPWGDRIMYVVNRNLTVNGGVATTRPTVVEATGQIMVQPDFILLSYGRDKLGAYPRASTAIGVACPGGATDALSDNRAKNCNGDPAFYHVAAFMAPNAGANSYFDDILVYYRQ